MTPTVAVIIPAYNHARFLPETLASVLNQTLPPTQIIVVDDGSTDDTAKVLQRFAGRIVAVHQSNQGVSKARNHGAQLASSELLAFLDADDTWLPRKLELQVARFKSAPHLGLVHVGVEDIDAEGRVLRQHLDGIEGSVAHEMLLFRQPVILGGGSGVIIPLRVFREVGGFDPALSTSADWDLYFRITLQFQIGFIHEVLLRYRVHAGNMHGNVALMERDMLHAYAKVFRGAHPKLRRWRRQAYGNLHKMLAGSYFCSGKWGSFWGHSWRSLLFTPENSLYFLGFFLRRWQRSRMPESIVGIQTGPGIGGEFTAE